MARFFTRPNDGLYGTVVAGLIILPVYLIRGHRPLLRRDWIALFLLGLVGVVFNQMFFILGLSRTSVAHAALGSEGIALVTIHQMSIAERTADRIVMLAAGRVVAHGTLDELRERAGAGEASLEDVFKAILRKEAGDVAA